MMILSSASKSTRDREYISFFSLISFFFQNELPDDYQNDQISTDRRLIQRTTFILNPGIERFIGYNYHNGLWKSNMLTLSKLNLKELYTKIHIKRPLINDRPRRRDLSFDIILHPRMTRESNIELYFIQKKNLLPRILDNNLKQATREKKPPSNK